MRMRSLLVSFTFLALFLNVGAYNFLVVCPVFAYSHIKFMNKVADTLADGGHNVTLLQTYLVDHWGTIRLVKNKNIKIVDYHMKEKATDESDSAAAFKYLWDSEIPNTPIGAISPMFFLYDLFRPMCNQILSDKELHGSITAEKFDGYVAEAFDFCSLYLGDHLKLNLLPMFSSIRHVAASRAIGEPSPLNFAPSLHTNYGPSQTLWDRIQDITMVTSFYYALSKLSDRQFSQASTILNGDVRHWTEILQTSTFFFLNNNPYIGFPMPNLEKTVEIGGFTIDAAKNLKLDEDYDRLLSLRTSTVLISFGTVCRSADMPKKFKEGIIGMMKNLPDTTFIWKYEQEDLKGLPENVILKKWVPQPALLADKRLNLFVTHGGLGSTLEVAFSGKPSIMIPIFGDQLYNAKMLSRHGGAKFFSKYDLEHSEMLTEAVREVVSSDSFNKNALLLFEMLQNQPIKPKENLLKHAEFSARFGRVTALEPYNVHYNFIQYYMLDAYAIIISLFFAILYLTYVVFTRAYRRFLPVSQSKSKND